MCLHPKDAWTGGTKKATLILEVKNISFTENEIIIINKSTFIFVCLKL